MAILFKRLLVSVLVPFVWKRWRNRRTEPVHAAGSNRSLRNPDAGPRAATSR